MTPLLAFQADTTQVNYSSESIAAINNMANNPQIGVLTDIRDAYHRLLATAGLELRFPLLFASANSSHVVEPMAQLFARNDEPYTDGLGIPNEDAQSFVFDATSLFERDKFSGYDRIEGGTRANIGFRYSGAFGNGWTANGIVGQSYHLAGENSFAAPDLVNAGAYSGLETDTSDFVGLIGFASPDRPVGVGQRPARRADARNSAQRAQGRLHERRVLGFGEIRLHPGAAALRLRRRPQGTVARRLGAPPRKLARVRIRHLRFRAERAGEGRVRLRL